MGLYAVWKRDFNDPIDFYFGMLAHEMFHPFQFKQPGLQAKMEQLSKSTYTNFYRGNPDFAKLADREEEILGEAILAGDLHKKRQLIREALVLRQQRQARFFVGKNQELGQGEPLVEMVEGTAEYMNFRVMIDAKNFPKNERLLSIDRDFDGFARYRKNTLKEALKLVRSRPSYIQNLGVHIAILLDQVRPGWQTEIFNRERGGEELLKEFVSSGVTSGQ